MISSTALKNMIKTGEKHNLAQKDSFHTAAKKYLTELALNQLGLTKGEFEVRSNKGGPGVLGEVILHTDKLYVQLGGSVPWGDQSFYYRSCKGRRDYTGGVNQFMKYNSLENMTQVAEAFKKVMR